MLKVRQTFDRLRGRSNTEGIDRKRRMPKFPKIHWKLKFFKKRKHDAPTPKAVSERGDPELAEELARMSTSEDNILAKTDGHGLAKDEYAMNGVKTESSVIQINVECHEDDASLHVHNGTPFNLTPAVSFERMGSNRMSKSSFGTGLSRASMISQKSMSIGSVRGPDTRTVWTQTEGHELTNIPTQTSSTNLVDDHTAVVQTSTTNLLEVPSRDQSSNGGLTEETSETTWTSMEFGIEQDVFAREPVENPILAGYKDRINFRLTYPSLEHADAETCVDLLRYAKVPYLVALNRKLSKEGGRFNEQFIEYRGLDMLLILMEEIANDGLGCMFDAVRMVLVSECATSLVNCPTGKDYIISHGEHIVTMARGTLSINQGREVNTALLQY